MMTNYRVFNRLWAKLFHCGACITFFLLWLPCYVHSVTLYKCLGPDGTPQFQQLQCTTANGAEINLDTNVSPWRQVRPVKKLRRKAEKSTAKKKGSRKKTVSEVSCWRAEKRKGDAVRKLRQGYKRSEGERLQQQRRDAEEYLQRFCG